MDYTLILVTIAALLVGARLPDIDLAPVLPLRHRSAWTHGPVLPLAVAWAVERWLPGYGWPLLALLWGMVGHYVSDLLPKSWRGAARINAYPLAYVAGPVVSWLWLAAGIGACVWQTVELFR